MKPGIFYGFLTATIVFVSIKSSAQSILLSPGSTNVGIYSKAATAVNPFLPLPAYTVPDSGAGTRFMWIPQASALRVGTAFANEWNIANIGGFSTAIGVDLLATGGISAAFGYQNIASGFQSFVAGFNNQSTGNRSFSMGSGNLAQGNTSVALGSGNSIQVGGASGIAIGNSNQVKNEMSVAIGKGNSLNAASSYSFGIDNAAAGQKSVAIGNNSSASGFSSVAIGQSSKAQGQSSQAFGDFNSSLALSSLSMGSGNRVSGDNGVVIGRALISNIRECMVVGSFNDSVSTNPNSPNSFLLADPVFMIGNGEKEGARSNAITVLKNGRTGFGTTAPTQVFDVNGSGRIRALANDAQNTTFVTVEADGTLKKTTINLSDERLKTSFLTIENPIEKVTNLKGYSYEFKDSPGQRRIGFIAQEVQKTVPEVVFENDEGYKGIRYQELGALLTEAVKEQQKQIADLTEKVNLLTEVLDNQLPTASGK